MKWIGHGAAALGALALCGSGGALAAADATPAPAPSTATAPAAPPASAASDDVRFPREARNAAGRLVVHAPQVQAWRDYERMEAIAAVEATLNGKKTQPGTVHFEASTVADVAQHTVSIYDVQVKSTQFAGASAADQKALDAMVRDVVRKAPQKVPLDVVLRHLDETVIPTAAVGLSMTPPDIHYSSEPAVLVNIDGEPIKVPVDGTKLSYIANTNWDLYWQSREARWYLLNGKQWLVTDKGGSVAGPWGLAKKLPGDFNKLPDNPNFRATLAQVPPTVTSGSVPRVVVATKPAELIVTTGLPILVAIPGADLSYIDNTDADVFKLGNDWYYLVSGRWFTAQKLEGPWSGVARLPEQFSRIPAEHPRGDVRVAVPGTEEAKLAALEADIPRKAEIKRTAKPGIEVTYNGEPNFVQVGQLPVFRATNSPYEVLRVGTSYYLCYNAVWWSGAAPAGPWAVAAAVPPEVYKIPASSPAYPCTYVYAYESDDDTVTTGYTSGYAGVFTVGVAVVYGTGWYYPPYYYPGYYPIYYPYPPSYGRGAWYNPATGNYGGAEAIYGPYGGAGRAAVYNPETGAYGRANAVWDSDEFAASAAGYNPRTGTGVATNRYRNEDGAWGESLVTRDGEWVHTQSHFSDGQGTVDFDTSGGASGQIDRSVEDGKITGGSEISKGDKSASSEMIRTEEGSVRQVTGSGGEQATFAYDRSSGDLYAAKDGNVYQRDDSGNWSQQGGAGQVAASQQKYRPLGPTSDGSTAATRPSSGELPQRTSQYPQRSTADPYANRSRELDRDYNARHQGYESYNRRSSGFSGARPRRR
jgi:hypothetical protein